MTTIELSVCKSSDMPDISIARQKMTVTTQYNTFMVFGFMLFRLQLGVFIVSCKIWREYDHGDVDFRTNTYVLTVKKIIEAERNRGNRSKRLPVMNEA
ncbi:MAG TPA: hypothetical protein VJI15_06160 [Candidatus Nanoarchaeia archaeon]|nr:hypothetical protein [Candidatus Nanoarchaeia archaeon]